MAGNGKYTNYAPTASGRNTRLGKLFVGTSTVKNPFAQFVETGDSEGARLALLNGDGSNFADGAIALLQPDSQDSGNAAVSLFAGQPVNLNYTGDPNGITAPNTAEGEDVVWAQPGDPANPFMPDLRSPGPGFTEAGPNTNMGTAPDAEISDVDEIKPGYIPGAPGTGTASPTTTSAPLRKVAKLGETVPLGTSDETKPFE